METLLVVPVFTIAVALLRYSYCFILYRWDYGFLHLQPM